MQCNATEVSIISLENTFFFIILLDIHAQIQKIFPGGPMVI